MTALWVILIILAVFWLLGRIRLGGLVQYDEDGLLVKVLVGPMKISVFPQKQLTEAQREKKKAREEKKKERREAKKSRDAAKKAKKEAAWRKKHPGQEPPEPEKKGGTLPPVLDLLPLVGEAAGGLKKRIRIDELTVHLTWAAGDPAETALGFGRANAIMGTIWSLLDNSFDVKEHDLGVAVDFDAGSPAVFIRAALTTRLGQLTLFGLRLGVKFLSVLMNSRGGNKTKTKNQKQEAAK